MKLVSFLMAFCFLFLSAAFAKDVKNERKPNSDGVITIRTENYPRPPYSGATYFIYERGSRIICTKLKVCNKFDDCEVSYYKGMFKDQEDVETGNPYDSTPAQEIPANKLNRHLCLTKFGFVSK